MINFNHYLNQNEIRKETKKWFAELVGCQPEHCPVNKLLKGTQGYTFKRFDSGSCIIIKEEDEKNEPLKETIMDSFWWRIQIIKYYNPESEKNEPIGYLHYFTNRDLNKIRQAFECTQHLFPELKPIHYYFNPSYRLQDLFKLIKNYFKLYLDMEGPDEIELNSNYSIYLDFEANNQPLFLKDGHQYISDGFQTILPTFKASLDEKKGRKVLCIPQSTVIELLERKQYDEFEDKYAKKYSPGPRSLMWLAAKKIKNEDLTKVNSSILPMIEKAKEFNMPKNR